MSERWLMCLWFKGMFSDEVAVKYEESSFFVPRDYFREADACKGTGQVAALLRREGLYSSALTEWRRARAAGLLGALDPGKPGPKPQGVNPLAAENKRLQKEKRALERRLRRAELLLEIQKKASELMGIELDQQLQDDESE